VVAFCSGLGMSRYVLFGGGGVVFDGCPVANAAADAMSSPAVINLVAVSSTRRGT
jgi:hypothetical protein